jgi:dTMP kinase
MFLAFEGIDGVGKSTQLTELAEYLRECSGKDVLVLQEPGGSELGERVRALVLDPALGPLDASTEVFLFMAARSHLVSTRIRPALAENKTVLCDRFLWSSVVYQGIVGGLGSETVLEMGRVATGGTMPTQTFLFDLPVPEASSRKVRRGQTDRIENKGDVFQEELRAGFLQLANEFPDAITVIDASGTEAEVQSRLRAEVEKSL